TSAARMAASRRSTRSSTMRLPHLLRRDEVYGWRFGVSIEVSDVRFGSEADICAATSHVRFTPNSDRKSRHAANGHVCFPPESGHVQCTSSCLLWAKSGHGRSVVQLPGADAGDLALSIVCPFA